MLLDLYFLVGIEERVDSDTCVLGVVESASVFITVFGADTGTVGTVDQAEITVIVPISVADTLALVGAETATTSVHQSISVVDTLALVGTETSAMSILQPNVFAGSQVVVDAATRIGQGFEGQVSSDPWAVVRKDADLAQVGVDAAGATTSESLDSKVSNQFTGTVGE